VGRKPSIDRAAGAALLAAFARTGNKAAAAREVGVSEQAAKRFLADVPVAAAAVVTTQAAAVEQAGASLFDTRAALEGNYRRVLRLLPPEDAPLSHLDAAGVAALTGVHREVRAHVESGMKLLALLVSVDEVRAFQQAVLEEIGEADRATRDRIVGRLQSRHRLAAALGAHGGA